MKSDKHFIPLIDPTPEPKRLICRISVWLIAVLLTYGSFIVAITVWWTYDLFYGIGALLIAYLLTGIIRSKLRNSSIPQMQQEYDYTDRAVAAWFVSRRMLCDLQSDD